MEAAEISLIVELQRAFFQSGATLPLEVRQDALRRLREAMVRLKDFLATYKQA